MSPKEKAVCFVRCYGWTLVYIAVAVTLLLILELTRLTGCDAGFDT